MEVQIWHTDDGLGVTIYSVQKYGCTKV